MTAKSPTEIAFDACTDSSLHAESVKLITGGKPAHQVLLRAMLYASFAAGAKYATERRTSAGLGKDGTS